MTRYLMLSAILCIPCASALAWAPPGDAPRDTGKSANTPRGYTRAVERAEWEISFADDISLEEYARQIDYFKIEIAAVSKNGKIEYISLVSRRKPERRVGSTSADYRLHIGWKKGTLHAVDRKLLAKAGISSQGKELWHFFPTQAQVHLGELERAYADREPSQINRTRFEIRPKADGGGYEFFVVEQDPPAPGKPEPSPAAASEQPGKH